MERPAERMVAAALPDDLLAEVLRRLAPRCLAASRCVCKPWRDLVDERRLLRADLLPRSLAGIFVNFHCLWSSEFFARPSSGAAAISGNFDFVPSTADDGFRHHQVEDHCNGLLLIKYRDCVINPATRWWARLPPRPPPREEMDCFHVAYLVFDPAVSPQNYEVFLVPSFRWKRESDDELDPMLEASEWPPESYALPVFSSSTGLWKERNFIRQGQAAGTVADMRSDWPTDTRNGVYWRGALYLHCQTNFIIRISLNDDKYQVIKPPEYSYRFLNFYLGRSEKGVYLALSRDDYLKVWILDETCSEMKWELKHDKDITHILLRRNNRPGLGPWILQDINYHKDPYTYDDIVEAPEQKKVEFETNKEAALEKFEWISDDENVLDNEDRVTGGYHEYIDIIGFHPYKEIIFLGESLKRGLAYRLSNSKVEDIGNLYPTNFDYELPNEQFITASFPYTPCFM